MLHNLQATDFRLFDNDRPRPFTLDTSVSPVSVVIAVQANPDIRAYLPFIAKVGNALDALLIGESGESAAIVYGDEVTVAKPFDSGDLSSTLRRLASDGRHARAIDAGVRALALLRQRPATRNRVILFIGQPADHGSEYRLDDLRREPSATTSPFTRSRFRKSAGHSSRIPFRSAVSRRAIYWSAAALRPAST